MVAAIDFAHLSLQDALDLAILVEEEAQERYLELADQMEKHHTPEAARFFATMARNEQKHGEDLRPSAAPSSATLPARVTRSQLWDVEAPDYDQPRAFMSARRRCRWRSPPRRRRTSSSCARCLTSPMPRSGRSSRSCATRR